jgi:hypothetical protein
MIYLITRSNTDTMNIAELLESNNIFHEIDPIPKDVDFNCGICVKVSYQHLSLVWKILFKFHQILKVFHYENDKYVLLNLNDQGV